MTDDRTDAEKIDPTEFVDADDPRYKGFRIKEYWMATAIDHDDMEAPLFVSPLMATMFHLAYGPAMAADERRLINLREFAAWSASQYGIPIYIRHYVPDGDPEIKLPISGGIASD
jgi:hypothetical protein